MCLQKIGCYPHDSRVKGGLLARLGSNAVFLIQLTSELALKYDTIHLFHSLT